MEVIVIGTQPPCIRCLTTFKRAKEVAQQFPEKIEVRKIAIHSEEADKYGKVESGHGIGEAARMKPDAQQMMKLMGDINGLMKDEVNNECLIEAKLKELETALQPVKDKAKELGYLMTPVVVVNGQVKSMDYVPDKEEIKAWIQNEQNR